MCQTILKDDYYTFSQIIRFPLICAFSNRGLNLGLKNLDNRRKFLEKLEINYKDLVCLKQVHGDGIVLVRKKDKGKMISKKDALITGEKNLPIAVFTADCLPIFLYDIKGKVICLIHAGKRGTEKEITKKTVFEMIREYNTEPGDLWAGFGPAIRSCCYPIDLIRENFNQLIKLGVKRKNISDSKFCTSCGNDKFFSYRKEGNLCGRMMSVMMLK